MLKRRLQYVGMNGAFAVLLYLSLFQEREWAWNLYRFFMVVFMVLMIFCCLGLLARPEACIDAARKSKIRPVPVWLDWIYDLASVIPLVAFGHFVWGAIYMIACMFFPLCVRTLAESAEERAKKKKEQADPEQIVRTE